MSRLDETRLENVVRHGERIEARCPACAEAGHDKSGNHLTVYPSGAFACVQFPKDQGKEHRKRIFALAGVRDKKRGVRRYNTLEEGITDQEKKLKMLATRRDFYNEKYVVVRFDNKEEDEKDYRPFHSDGLGWVMKDPKGPLPLFNLKKLGEPGLKDELVFVVEGEKCVGALEEIGVLATTSAHGAKGARKTDWTPMAGRLVVITPDNDDTGKNDFPSTVANLLLELSPGVTVKVLHLPDLPPKGDCVEWIATRNGKAPEEIKAELLGLAERTAPLEEALSQQDEEDDDEEKRPRIALLPPPKETVTLAQWRATIDKNFPTLRRPAEVCLCVEVQMQLNDVHNPFALAVVDVPSSGKTIILNFFDGLPELTYTTDNFTAAAFVSHASNVKREDLDKVDLLPRIRYRTMIVRELGSIFGAKDDDLIKSLGILTRVLDGEGLQTDSGVHGRRGYAGDYVFMFLGATPPIPPRVFKIMGNFGSRLFFLALRTPEESDEELVAQNQGIDRKTSELACKNATSAFLQRLWSQNQAGITWDKRGDSRECLLIIARCARLLAALRGAINIWYDEASDKLSHTVPVIEKPNRINCLLYNLARGHAVICGRRQLEEEDLWPVLDVTFDSAPMIRAKLFRGLLEAGGTLTTSEVVELLNCSPPTARKEMEALSALGVVEKTFVASEHAGHPEAEITLTGRFTCFATDECKKLMSKTKSQQTDNSTGWNPFSYAKPIKQGFPPYGSVEDIEVNTEASQESEETGETPPAKEDTPKPEAFSGDLLL
jgi:hypothetical protein